MDLKRTYAIALAALAAMTAAGPAIPQTGAAQGSGRPASSPSDMPQPDVDPAIPVVLLVDLASGQTLFERETRRRFVPASVTKVMTAYSAFRMIEDGALSPDAMVTIDKEIADSWYAQGSTMFLKAGDEVTVEQLLIGITTVSANDASVVLAHIATGSVENWLELMNANAAELGMRDTHFGTPNGWPDEGYTFTTAADLAILAEAMTTRYPDLYRRFFGRRGMSYNGIAQNNHDPVTGVIDGADGIKTGYTRQSGYNFLGSAERDGRRLVVVVAAAPTIPLRNSASRDVLRWGFDSFETREVLPAGADVGEALVQDGAGSRVPLRTQGRVLAAIPRGQDADVTLTVRYRGPIEAPIAEGARIATLRVSIPGQREHDVPLVAGADVPRANAWQRLMNGVAGFFS